MKAWHCLIVLWIVLAGHNFADEEPSPNGPMEEIAQAARRLATDGNSVAVLGEVMRPQRMPWASDLRVSGAVGNAGGTWDTPRVFLFRNGVVILKTNLNKLQHQKVTDDPLLKPRDIIYVGSIHNR